MKKTWWKEGVIYQVYPRSFQDSNGDGIGDLPGILRRVPYLADLGVDIVWLSPVYQSPNDDNGYDISDYYAIMTEFGSMADFDALLAAVHNHGMRLVLDLVVNHTSDEHRWFQEARKGQGNPFRDFYHWRSGKDGGPPNNWRSFFSGSAWEHDPASDEYYLHLFTRRQPDLNWENPRVREEVYKLMRFWLDKGVDGFRMDVIPLLSKDMTFADKDWEELGGDHGRAYANGPRVHEFLREMNEQVLSRYDGVSIGEGIGVTQEEANAYVGESRGELDLIFHFGHMFIDHGKEGRYDPRSFGREEFTGVFESWEKALGDRGWGTLYLGNHDFPRMLSRFGDPDHHPKASAKLLATLLMTLKGTPTLYQGDEIGMTNCPFPRLEDLRDVEAFNALEEWQAKGGDPATFLALANRQGRDNARTPMQWDASPHGGFTTGTPWVMANPNYQHLNVATQETDPDSVLNYYRRIIAFRKAHPALTYGQTQVLPQPAESVYAYTRAGENERFLIVLNFSSEPQDVVLPASGWNLTLGNLPPRYPDRLEPWEARIYHGEAN
jgi:oligo-1,6-glucosidase